MKHLSFTLLSLGLVLGAVLLSGASPARATEDAKVAASPRLSISVSVQKSAETPGAYECSILVTDLATGSDIAAPTIIAKYGQSAEAVGSLPGGETLRAHVTVDSSETVAEYTVSLSRGTDALARHQGKVSLSR